jgi:general stress protein CsbA
MNKRYCIYRLYTHFCRFTYQLHRGVKYTAWRSMWPCHTHCRGIKYMHQITKQMFMFSEDTKPQHINHYITLVYMSLLTQIRNSFTEQCWILITEIIFQLIGFLYEHMRHLLLAARDSNYSTLHFNTTQDYRENLQFVQVYYTSLPLQTSNQQQLKVPTIDTCTPQCH